MNKKHILIGLIIVLFALFNLQSLLIYPLVWSDEAIFANTFESFIKAGKLGTTLWPMSPGFENLTLYYPPLYFLIHIFVFKVFPLSVYNMRIISLATGVLFLLIFAKTLVLFTRNTRAHWLLPLIFLGLATDDTFIKMVKFSRPEIFLLLFWIVSMYLLYKGLIVKTDFRINKFSQFLCGVFAGLVFLTHYIGVFVGASVLLWVFLGAGTLKAKVKKTVIFVIGFTVTTLPWLFILVLNSNLFITQMMLVQQAKSNNPLTWKLFLYEISPQQLVSLVYLFLTMAIIYFMIRKKSLVIASVGLQLVLAWMVTVIGNNLTYYVIPISVLYLGVYIVLDSMTTNSRIYKTGLILVILATFLNMKGVFRQAMLLKNNSDYEAFSTKILEIIPNNKTVLLSVVPDPYFKFISEKRNNILIEHPVPISNLDEYQKAFDQTDYVVMNNLYNEKVYGKWLQNNLSKRQRNVYLVRVADYSAYVFELNSINSSSK